VIAVADAKRRVDLLFAVTSDDRISQSECRLMKKIQINKR
jgi:hypothetical protein